VHLLASGSSTPAVLAAVFAGVGAVLAASATGLAALFWTRQRQASIDEQDKFRRVVQEIEFSQERIAQEQVSRVSINVERLVEDIQGSPRSALHGDAMGELEQVVREMSHSLNTPLAQIELALSELADNPQSSPGPRARGEISRAMDTLQLCRAVLAAYRDVTSIATVATHWDIRNLLMAIQSVVGACIAGLVPSKDLRVEVVAPLTLAGYSNYFVVSLLLPLIQNAIEAAPPGSEVQCRIGEGADFYVLSVSNSSEVSPEIYKLAIPNYTTKSGGHAGLGLASVRTLLSRQAHQGARLDLNFGDGLFTANVRLPRRASAQ
jgi:signal transduction histidine kinase